MSRVLLFQYLFWHFSDVPKNILLIWRNFLFFNLNYFSVPTLVKTYFSHWHRYYYPYGQRFDPWRYLEAFIFNTFSRIIGAILRTFLIIIGILLEILIILLGIIIFLGWFLLPLFLLVGLILGIELIF